MVIEIERIRHFYDSRILKSHWYHIFCTFYCSWHRFLGGSEKEFVRERCHFIVEKERKRLKSILNDIKLIASIHHFHFTHAFSNPERILR